MDKRYQVFVSSTYEDLRTERQEVMQALLELDCIPAGMELFPAADDDQWTLIKRVIDDCDYYLVIVGGRYGSIAPHGMSYTQKEYEYAIQVGKPVMAFLHKDPKAIAAGKTEDTKEGRERLNAFRDLCQRKACKYWTDAKDLGSMVSRSVVRLIKDKPAVGWVKATNVPDVPASEEILRLRQQLDLVQSELAATRMGPPPGTEVYAQGDDQFSVSYKFTIGNPYPVDDEVARTAVKLSWNGIFADIAPILIDEASESAIELAIERHIFSVDSAVIKELAKGRKVRNLDVFGQDFQTVKVQLRALGLMMRSDRKRPIRDTETYWTLTPFGDELMTRLRAIRHDQGPKTNKARLGRSRPTA